MSRHLPIATDCFFWTSWRSGGSFGLTKGAGSDSPTSRASLRCAISWVSTPPM